MTAALFRVAPGALTGVAIGDTVMLEGAEAHHACVVKRVRPGENVLVTDGSGAAVQATVIDASPHAVGCRVTEFDARASTTAPVRLVLVQALAKNGRDEQAVETATELGVDEVVPWRARRCIVRWSAERSAKGRQRWQATAAAAAKQARRASVPHIAEAATTGDVVTRLVGAAIYVLHEDAETVLGVEDLPASGEIAVVVGPEGGITPEELADLGAAGARVVRLGPTILRSSSAGPAALAVIAAHLIWPTAGRDPHPDGAARMLEET